MQRINDNDLSAHVLATKEENYLHLKIEAEAPQRRVITFPSGRILVREPNDLLWPEREGPFEIRRQKAVMGKWKYAAQYQQDPIPEGGAIFQREWFSHRFHRDPDTGIPLGAKLRMIIQSWDTAAKKKEINDYSIEHPDARVLTDHQAPRGARPGAGPTRCSISRNRACHRDWARVRLESL